MLTITIKGDEIYDESTETFSSLNDIVIDLEHSLVSLSNWEAAHGVPFLSSANKTPEEIFDYLRLMILTPGIDPDILYLCEQEDLNRIQQYIDSNQSATSFSESGTGRGRGEIITSEIIYYWMVAFNIPFECQHWHLNRLFALIRICNIKNGKQKKMPRNEIANRNRELNARRKAELNTNG